jgi:predicted aspartyl protease
MRVRVKINNKYVKATIYSGAEKSVISLKKAREFGLKIVESNRIVQIANNSIVPVAG